MLYWPYVSCESVISAVFPLAMPDVWEINPDIGLEAQQPIKPDVFYSKIHVWTELKKNISDKWSDRLNQLCRTFFEPLLLGLFMSIHIPVWLTVYRILEINKTKTNKTACCVAQNWKALHVLEKLPLTVTETPSKNAK